MPSELAQAADGGLPEGGSEAIVWLVVAAVIVGLYLVVRRTRNRSTRHYLSREEREQALRDADPDLKKPEDENR